MLSFMDVYFGHNQIRMDSLAAFMKNICYYHFKVMSFDLKNTWAIQEYGSTHRWFDGKNWRRKMPQARPEWDIGLGRKIKYAFGPLNMFIWSSSREILRVDAYKQWNREKPQQIPSDNRHEKTNQR